MTHEHDPEAEQELTVGSDTVDPATGRLRVLSRLCGTCVTYEDDRMYLGDRRQQFIAEALRADTYVVCHDTGTYSEHPAAICRGFFNRHWRDVASLRVAKRFDLITLVEPPAEGVVSVNPMEKTAKQAIVDSAGTGPILPPPRCTDDEIRQMAEHIMNRTLVHGMMMAPATSRLVFMPLTLLGEEQLARMDRDLWQDFIPVGMVGVHDTSPRSIDGWPIFHEFVWRHREDINTAIRLADRLRQAVQQTPVRDPSA